MSISCPPGTRSYTVVAGDTVFSLAQRFDTTVPAIVSANPTIDIDNLQIGSTLCIPLQPQFPSCPEGNFYTIQSGDTFFSIARFFGISLDDLLEANPGVDPESLFVGQVICIPVATAPVVCPSGSEPYTIQRGDTFFSLAQRFNTTVETLRRLNPGKNPEALLIGDRICVPT